MGDFCSDGILLVPGTTREATGVSSRYTAPVRKKSVWA